MSISHMSRSLLESCLDEAPSLHAGAVSAARNKARPDPCTPLPPFAISLQLVTPPR